MYIDEGKNKPFKIKKNQIFNKKLQLVWDPTESAIKYIFLKTVLYQT
jgi:hypothetical protein